MGTKTSTFMYSCMKGISKYTLLLYSMAFWLVGSLSSGPSLVVLHELLKALLFFTSCFKVLLYKFSRWASTLLGFFDSDSEIKTTTILIAIFSD